MKMRHTSKITCQGSIVEQTSSQGSELNCPAALKELKEMLQTKREGRETSSASPGGAT